MSRDRTRSLRTRFSPPGGSRLPLLEARRGQGGLCVMVRVPSPALSSRLSEASARWSDASRVGRWTTRPTRLSQSLLDDADQPFHAELDVFTPVLRIHEACLDVVARLAVQHHLLHGAGGGWTE